MKDINLISQKRIFLISFLLSILTLSLLSQASINDTSDDENGDSILISSTTQSSTTQSSSTTNMTPSGANVDFTPSLPDVGAVENYDEAVKQSSQLMKADTGSISNSVDTLQLVVITGIKLIMLTIVFFLLIAMNYIFIFNSEEIREYLNRALSLAGFHTVVGLKGKKVQLTDKSQMSLRGIFKLKIIFTLPILENPQDFGLRIAGKHATTSCSLEMLPVKLQLIRLYLYHY